MSIYLDNAATSYPKPETVYREMDDYLRNTGVSSGRGSYQRALEADRLVFDTRRSLARLFGISDPSRIAFTCNATEAINLALKGFLSPGDHVITTTMEHNAVWRCLKTMEAKGRIEMSLAKCTEEGSLDPEDLGGLFRSKTRLVVMTHASNVTGTLMPVKETADLAHDRGVPLLVDAAQTAGAHPIDVTDLGIDFLAFTGHKGLLGPTGTGGLYIAPGFDLTPLKEGGTGSESLLDYQPQTLPERYEAGTHNVVGLVGLGAGVDFILDEGVGRIQRRKRELTAAILDGLMPIAGIRVYGPCSPDRQVAVIGLNIEGVRPEHVAHVLDQVYDIQVRAGLHCSPLAHRAITALDTGTLRVSPGYFTTDAQVDRLLLALRDVASRSQEVDM